MDLNSMVWTVFSSSSFMGLTGSKLQEIYWLNGSHAISIAR